MVKRNSKTAEVVVNQITISQLTRGNQDIQKWYTAVRAAEQTRSPNRRELYNTYLDVSIDLQLRSVIDKRIRGLKTSPFEWHGLDNEAILDNFKSPWFFHFLHYVQERIFFGTTVVEFALGPDGLISSVDLIPRQNVKPELGIISLNGSSNEGPSYCEPPYTNYILQIGNKHELGLLANIAPYVLMKRQNLADFSRYNEMFGMPLRVYEYDASKPNAREEVTNQAREYGSAAYIVIPKGMGTVRFEDSVKQSTAFAYDKLHEILNNEITIGVLGQLLTTGGEGGGSYELGKVHAAVEAAINMEDRLFAEYLINYPFKKQILLPHGYPLEGHRGTFKTAEAISKEKKLQLWIALLQSGAPIAEEDFYKEFGIAPPGTRPVIVRTASNNPALPEAAASAPLPPRKPPAPGKFTGSSLRTKLQAYYRTHTAGMEPVRGAITASYTSELTNIIDDIARRVLNGSLMPGDVDEKLWKLVADRLFNAVERGYGQKLTAATGTNKVMLEALQKNVYRFSGFKNYHFVLEANALLRNENGNLRGFTDFKKEILSLNKEYNINFLRTEYNHAIGTSRMASKWNKFKEDEAALPLLQFDTVGDERVRTSHQNLDGIIKPVNDPFWDKWLPPIGFNCRCTVRQLADGEVSRISLDAMGEPTKGFGVNWGKDRVIFPPSHPQFEIDSNHQQQADNNFGLPI